MIGFIIVVLIILWILGYIHLTGFPIPNFSLFLINGHTVRLWDLLILLVVGWAIGILPSPFREIATVLLILWILSLLGIIAIFGFSQIILIAIIAGIILSIFF